MAAPTVPGADYRNRIFIPGQEIPFAGHPSLGTAVAVARWLDRDAASFTQETGTGLQPVEVRREEDGEGGWERWRADMLQDEAELGDQLDHGAGLAVDIMCDPATGDQIAAFLQKNASELGIQYLIWEQRIWRPATSNSWRGMSDRGSPTANHMDHVHANT